MKRIAVLIFCLMLALPVFASFDGGLPMLYSDSYMLRARGTEANYWNPALLNENYVDIWLPATNIGFQINNNALDLDTYNNIMGKKFITEADKVDLLNQIDGSLRLNVGASGAVGGFTIGNVALSSSVRYYAKAALSEKYLELLLYGNTEETYEFDKSNNNASMLSYADLTVGMGDIKLPLPDAIPAIKAGFAASLLVGIEDIHTKHYQGTFTANIDGISVDQKLELRSGIGGLGFKAMLGLVSEPMPNLKVGVTLDNILGAIRWGLVRENLNYSFEMDSVYVADLNEDFYVSEYERVHGDYFSTNLPPEFRAAVMYSIPQVSVSADYVVAFDESSQTSAVGRLSMGAELVPVPFLPLHVGYSPGSSNYPWRVSYGFGIRITPLEFGFGMQSFESVIPSTKTKGLAGAMYFKFRI